MKLTDLTAKQTIRIANAAERMLEQFGECLAPKGHVMIYVAPNKPFLHIRHAMYMLANGETPQVRMRAKCRTVCCCNVDHLTPSDWKTLEAPKAGKERTRTTPLQQYQVYELHLDPRNRAVDIAIKLGIPPHRVNDAIKREGLRREKKRELRTSYLLDLKEARP